jgi:hypothetical protein
LVYFCLIIFAVCCKCECGHTCHST